MESYIKNFKLPIILYVRKTNNKNLKITFLY